MLEFRGHSGPCVGSPQQPQMLQPGFSKDGSRLIPNPQASPLKSLYLLLGRAPRSRPPHLLITETWSAPHTDASSELWEPRPPDFHPSYERKSRSESALAESFRSDSGSIYRLQLPAPSPHIFHYPLPDRGCNVGLTLGRCYGIYTRNPLLDAGGVQ